jgi:predicted phosphoribosyltransferase
MADEVVCASTPPSFTAVGEAYEDFAQTTDDEVRDVLRAASPGKEGPADG